MQTVLQQVVGHYLLYATPHRRHVDAVVAAYQHLHDVGCAQRRGVARGLPSGVEGQLLQALPFRGKGQQAVGGRCQYRASAVVGDAAHLVEPLLRVLRHLVATVQESRCRAAGIFHEVHAAAVGGNPEPSLLVFVEVVDDVVAQRVGVADVVLVVAYGGAVGCQAVDAVSARSYP